MKEANRITVDAEFYAELREKLMHLERNAHYHAKTLELYRQMMRETQDVITGLLETMNEHFYSTGGKDTPPAA